MDLKKDFTETTLSLNPDNEGENIATLIESQFNRGNRDTVLYLHGFIDYFFHPHVASEFHDNNMDFYALDLRKYGRSLRDHQTPNFCTSLEDYFEEISLAIQRIHKNTDKKIFILAHSTGCTTASLYMNKGAEKNAISGLILNSPFLEMPQSKIKTKLMYHTGKVLTRFRPMVTLPESLSSTYPCSLHKDFDGVWDFDLTLKPIHGFTGYFAWAIAIVDAQNWLKKQSNITVPVLSMHAQKSSQPNNLNDDVFVSDIVLNIEDMKKYSPLLGEDVTVLAVKDAIHDIFLSKEHVREQAFHEMFSWLKKI